MGKPVKKKHVKRLNKYSKSSKKTSSELIISYTILMLLIICLSFFYYNFQKKIPPLTGPHFYEYYTQTIVFAELIKDSDFTFLYHLFILSDIPDKLIILSRIPFFLFIEYNKLNFNFLNYFISMFFLLWLFKTLLRIEKPFRAFTITLFIIGGSFFLEMLFSFYIDLVYMLIFSIFLIHLYEFDKDHKKNNLSLTFLIFLLFLAKNMSYLIIPLLLIFLTLYYYFFRKDRWIYIRKIWIISIVGFFIFFVLIRGFNYQSILLDINHGSVYEFKTGSFGFNINSVLNFLADNIKNESIKAPLFLLKFSSIPLTIFLYLVLAYNIIKKKNRFWIMMFIFSEIFLFFLFNVKNHYFHLRFISTFYFIYFYLIYDFLYESLNKLFYKNRKKIIFLIVISLLLCNLINISIEIKEKGGYLDKYILTGIEELKIDVEPGSKVYIATHNHSYMISFIDENIINPDSFGISDIDSRFNYFITNDIEESDYIITNDLSKIDINNYLVCSSLKINHWEKKNFFLLKKK